MKKLLSLFSLMFLFSSCVSSKLYNEIEERYALIKLEHSALKSEKQNLQKKYDSLHSNYTTLYSDYTKEKALLATTSNTLNNLQKAHEALEKNSNEALQESIETNRSLLEQIQLKESELLNERNRLDSIGEELFSRINRVNELEELVAEKEALMNTLKTTLITALNSFEGKGLSVEQRDGKVYVSMENKLLFRSGSWTVEASGRRAIKELGNVLATNPDIAILIEGHTDTDPYSGNKSLSGNWDLSTKRATEIVKLLLQNQAIKPENLTAAGRGEFHPVEANLSIEGKAKNRRIEVILTPKLDKISELLKQID